MVGPFFPETGRGESTRFNSADTSLWFIWAVQQCCCQGKDRGKAWKLYGNVIKTILESYATGNQLLKMDDNGLLYISEDNPAVTWMNAMVNGKPVTPRYGYVVEVNALWYNAIMFALELAKLAKDKSFNAKWKTVAEKIPESFEKVFWNEEKGYLADYVAVDQAEWSVRPNQVIAASLPYSPVSASVSRHILDAVLKKLLTPKGLRTLSPDDPYYKGRYKGNEMKRDLALHQGTVYPWLLGHFAEAYLKVYKESAIDFLQDIYDNFQEDMTEDGIGTISELYEGDPPHQSRGAISFAASVAELIRINDIITKNKK